MLLSGYYGFKNLGDEALLEVISEQIHRRFPGTTLEVLSTNRRDWRGVRAAIARADVVLSGGGGLLQSRTSLRSLLYYAGVLREAISKKRKTMVFAQSVGPLDFWGRFIVALFCKGVDLATVRDERSRRLLQDLLPNTPIERTADPVFLYDLPQDEIDLRAEGLGAESGAYGVVCLRKAAAMRDGGRVIARAVDRLAQLHGVRAAFLPLGGALDAAVSTDVIRACESNPVLLPECNLAKAASILRGAHVVIAMRLHALVLAARFAVPFLAIPYDPKVASLCEDLRYPLEALWTPGARLPSGDAVDALVDRLIGQHDAIAAQLSAGLGIVRAAAERNFDLLAKLL